MRLSVLPLVAAICFVPSSAPFAQQATEPGVRRAPTERAANDGKTNISVETDVRLVTMAAALVLAGYSAGEDDPKVAALRAEVRRALADVGPDLKSRLQVAYKAQRRADVDEEVDAVRYRALAVLLNPPPSFSLGVSGNRIPPDVRDVVNFGALAGELYRTKAFRTLLPKLTDAYAATNADLLKQAGPSVGEVVEYLHTIPITQIDVPAARAEDGKLLRPAMQRLRRLKIFGDPLLGGRAAVARGDLVDAGDTPDLQRPGDRYFLFAGDSMLTADEAVRVVALRYLLDPILEKYSGLLVEYEDALAGVAARSEAAKSRYGGSYMTLIADSLVSAADARLRVLAGRMTENGAVARLGDAHDRGQVLALHFYDRLKRVEQVGMDIAVVFPELIQSVTLEGERGRAEQIAAARTAAAAERKAAPADDVVAQRILEADKLITAKRFPEARPLLEEVLKSSPNNARALFGLAQVVENSADPDEAGAADDEALMAAQAERLERAVNLYRRAALNATSRELWIASWSHVYAGRILDFLDLRDDAVAEYNAALKVGDVPNGAYREATAGVKAPYAPPGAP
jgi:hypothetical protein